MKNLIKQLKLQILLLLTFVPAFAQQSFRPVDFVDPLIDCHNSRWFYFNSATRPFGMVNLSPDTQTKGSWQSGYLYGDKYIRAFSHIHAWQMSGVAVLPITGEMTGHKGMDVYQSEFSHDDEVVKAGYHKVQLKKYDITAELSATTRVGFHRYTYPTTKDAYVLVDAGAMLGHSPMTTAEVKQISATQLEGMSMMGSTVRRKKDFPVYFVIEFNQPMTEFGGWEENKEPITGTKEISGKESGAYARFSTKKNKPLLMKVGISYTSVAGARKNLESELAHWDFDRVVQESSNEWNSLLSRIMVEGGTDKQKTKFYTDLWRATLGRRIFSDTDGAYRDMTGASAKIRNVPLNKDGKPKFAMHNFDGWWGSHWSLDILWPLLCPETYSDICNTSVEMYKNGGLVPRGPSGGNYTFVMIGASEIPFITAAYAKGIRDFDYKKALEGLVRNTEADGARYYGGYASDPTPKSYEDYATKGYIALENHLGGYHGSGVSSLTLYNAYHDWCIAQMAKGMNNEEIYSRFISAGNNYKHVIWPEKKSAWVRLNDGSWKPGFSTTDDQFEQDGFCESSAAISTFFVPHDAKGLAQLLGGTKSAAELLDTYFEKASKHDFCEKKAAGRSHASYEIDYANQDGTGAAHYFNRIGYPWLSQKWVRAVQKQTFSGADPYNGYNGDEDQGQMGALSALMAMGLFQFDGGSGTHPEYDITAPVFDKVTIHLSDTYYNGNTFTIKTKNQGTDNVYIQSAKWNGKRYHSSLLPHDELVKGGVLELKLGSKPNKKWGVR